MLQVILTPGLLALKCAISWYCDTYGELEVKESASGAGDDKY